MKTWQISAAPCGLARVRCVLSPDLAEIGYAAERTPRIELGGSCLEGNLLTLSLSALEAVATHTAEAGAFTTAGAHSENRTRSAPIPRESTTIVLSGR